MTFIPFNCIIEITNSSVDTVIIRPGIIPKCKIAKENCNMSETYTISNGILTASFISKGGEMISLKNSDGKEFLFRDNQYWDFTAPVLFPICGGLRDDKYILEGKEYFLGKHGFARTADFVMERKTDTSITFLLTETEETLKSYPFRFEFRIVYSLDGGSVDVGYYVENKSEEEMYFSVGSHEAYLAPEGIESYRITFEKSETLDSHIVTGPLLEYETVPIISDTDTLELKKSYFDVDALVFSKFNSHSAVLSSADSSRAIKVDYPGATHLLIWTKTGGNAPFVCIEPWFGFPDMVDSDHDITHKPGINHIKKGDVWIATHTITPMN